MRRGIAILLLGAALAGALVLHAYRVGHHFAACANGGNGPAPCTIYWRPGWADPVAVGICLAAVAAATGLLLFARRPRPGERRALVSLIVVVALFGALVLHGQKNRTTRVVNTGGTFPSLIPMTEMLRPGWADPAAVGLLVLGAAGVFGVLAGRGRNRQPALT